MDGDSKTTCIHSMSGVFFQNPWWRVDLEQVEPVNEVYIVNRGDCCGFRLNPFEIRVGKTKLHEALLEIIFRYRKWMERNFQNRGRSASILIHLIRNIHIYLGKISVSPNV